MVILSLLDYKDLKILGFAAYGFTTPLLVLVLIIGKGARKLNQGMAGSWAFHLSTLRGWKGHLY